MAITRQTSRRTLILTPSNAEVSTNQVYAARYEWRVDGELVFPVSTVIDSLKHTDAAFSIYRVDVSVNVGGTSQYLVVIKSYDTAGLNPVTHVSDYVTLTGNRNRVSIPVINAAVPENSSLELSLIDNTTGMPAQDMTVTLIAEDFADLVPERLGHRVLNASNVVQAQRPDLKFDVSGAGLSLSVTDNSVANRTEIKYQMNMGFIGQMLQSMLTEAQMQSLYGTGWILADGRSVVGSTYASVTGASVVPDARGVFLRGKNNGRSDGKENPGGDFALGTYQEDGNKSHNHMMPFSDPIPGSVGTTYGEATGQPNAVTEDGGGTITSTRRHLTNVDGVLESRPKNLTVNTFIKIN